MKLIDILVSELPKRGGWPEPIDLMFTGQSGQVFFQRADGGDAYYLDPGIYQHNDMVKGLVGTDRSGTGFGPEVVTKAQYYYKMRTLGKSPIFETKKQWDGTGLPPVGTECEIYQHPEFGVRPGTAETGTKVKVVSHETTTGKISVAVAFWDVDGYGYSDVFIAECLRPLGSAAAEEENHKRQDACDMIFGAMRNAERSGNMSDMADEVYDAIAAGKIPGIKLDNGK